MTALPIPEPPPDWRRPIRHAVPLDKANLPRSFSAKVAGVSFHPGYPESLLDLDPDERLKLTREPGNEIDPNAVAVVSAGQDVLGHLPAGLAARLAPEMDAGQEWVVTSWRVLVDPVYTDRPGLSVDLEAENAQLTAKGSDA